LVTLLKRVGYIAGEIRAGKGQRRFVCSFYLDSFGGLTYSNAQSGVVYSALFSLCLCAKAHRQWPFGGC